MGGRPGGQSDRTVVEEAERGEKQRRLCNAKMVAVMWR
jgi:hypothetical protein